MAGTGIGGSGHHNCILGVVMKSTPTSRLRYDDKVHTSLYNRTPTPNKHATSHETL